jgi:hypothetical protein
MGKLWPLLRAAFGAEFDLWRDHAGRRAGLVLALVVCGIVALLLLFALAIAVLAMWIGPVAALAVALGLAVLICLILLIALQLEARAHARRAAARAAERRRLIEATLLAALPSLRARSALAVGLAVLALTLLTAPRDKGGDKGG